MKTVIFGAGLYYENRRRILEAAGIEIVAFLDNNPSKEGGMMDGVKIMNPLKVNSLHYDAILLMSKVDNHREMIQQLINLDITEDKIITYEEFMAVSQQIEYKCKCGKDIFILYDKLRKLINSAEFLPEADKITLKQSCKEKLILGMEGIFLENFWK